MTERMQAATDAIEHAAEYLRCIETEAVQRALRGDDTETCEESATRAAFRRSAWRALAALAVLTTEEHAAVLIGLAPGSHARRLCGALLDDMRGGVTAEAVLDGAR